MADLEIDLLTLRMSLKHENNISKEFFSENWNENENEVLHLFLPLLAENSFLTLKLTFDLEFYPSSANFWRMSRCYPTVSEDIYP